MFINFDLFMHIDHTKSYSIVILIKCVMRVSFPNIDFFFKWNNSLWANSVDPDQTAPWSSLIRVHTVSNFFKYFR